MALDERDRNFEKALARHLHSGVDSENSANLQGNREALDSACPDPEILAAYHERSLSPEELICWKSHIANCARCQQLLAHLELTDGIPVNAELVGAQHANNAAAAPAQSTKVQVLPIKRYSLLRWIAPAGAIAACLLVWIAVRENSSLRAPQSSPVQIAERTQPSAATASPKSGPPAQEETKRDEASRRINSPAHAAKEKESFAAKSIPVTNLPIQGRNRQEVQLSQLSPGTVNGALSANQDSAAIEYKVGTSARSRVDSNQAAGMQQNIEAQSNNARGASQAAPPAAPLPTQNQAPSSASAAAQSAQNQVVVGSDAREFSQALALKKVRSSTTRDARLAAAPGGNVIWHVGLEGLIEKSTDRGKTFARLESGVKSELVAASAPDDSVCWVVGRSGTILLTVDGGAHWSKLVSPIQENIGSVHADDASHAVIWDITHRIGFITSDGGTTWARVASE